jgi:hypothetical protein
LWSQSDLPEAMTSEASAQAADMPADHIRAAVAAHTQAAVVAAHIQEEVVARNQEEAQEVDTLHHRH